jgi:hypothetical protein
MDHRLIATVLVVLAALTVTAGETPKSVPKIKAVFTCHIGRVDSGVSCSGTNFQPDGVIHGEGKMTCGHPGKISEIAWEFLRHKNDADVYRFTRRPSASKPESPTEQKTIEFKGQRIVIFQDENQVVTIETPRPEEKAEPAAGADSAERGAAQP